MLISIHSGLIRYESLAHNHIRASHWTIWLMISMSFCSIGTNLARRRVGQGDGYFHNTLKGGGRRVSLGLSLLTFRIRVKIWDSLPYNEPIHCKHLSLIVSICSNRHMYAMREYFFTVVGTGEKIRADCRNRDLVR